MAPQWLTIVASFGNHLPLCRQAGILERQGGNLDHGSPGNRVGRACFHLMPVINHMRAHLQSGIENLIPWRFNQPSSLAEQGDVVALALDRASVSEVA